MAIQALTASRPSVATADPATCASNLNQALDDLVFHDDHGYAPRVCLCCDIFLYNKPQAWLKVTTLKERKHLFTATARNAFQVTPVPILYSELHARVSLC